MTQKIEVMAAENSSSTSLQYMRSRGRSWIQIKGGDG